jgi:membrane protein DedA with SNARE-associated domain
MGILDNLGELVIQYPEWSHWIIAIAILFQGEVVVLVSVFLIVSGSLTWGGFIIPSVASLIIGDTLLFFLGRIVRNTRVGWKLYMKMKHSRRAQFYLYYVKENINKLMIISKYLVAANVFAVLAVSWSKVGFGKFLKSQFTSVMLWFFSATAVAYFLASGFSYLRTEKVFRQIEIGILITMILLFVGEHFLKKVLQRSFQSGNKVHREDGDEEEEMKIPGE